MDAHQFSSSELIYLFLDGEHTSVERALLFKAMSENEDLQYEFEDALKIRNAALAEAQSLIPPAAVTQSLMSRAGFATAGAALGAGSTGWLSGMFSQWGSVALMVAVPILTGVGGYLIGTQSQNMFASGESFQSIPQAISSTNSGSSADVDAAAQKLRSQLLVANNRIRVLQNTVTSQRRQIAEAESTPTATISTNYGAGHDLGSESSHVNLDGAPSLSSTMRISTPSFVQTAPIIQMQNVHVAAAPITVQSQFRETGVFSGASADWSLELRQIRSVSQSLGNLALDKYSNSLANVVGSVQYFLGPELRLIGEIGHENMPHYEFHQQQSPPPYDTVQNVLWSAAGIRFLPNLQVDLSGIQPFGQLLLGGSAIGPLIRSMIGFQWQPDTRLSIVGGLEYTVIQLTRQQYTNNLNKLGFSYGVRLNF